MNSITNVGSSSEQSAAAGLRWRRIVSHTDKETRAGTYRSVLVRLPGVEVFGVAREHERRDADGEVRDGEALEHAGNAQSVHVDIGAERVVDEAEQEERARAAQYGECDGPARLPATERRAQRHRHAHAHYPHEPDGRDHERERIDHTFLRNPHWPESQLINSPLRDLERKLIQLVIYL